jgi:hypothetical protein
MRFGIRDGNGFLPWNRLPREALLIKADGKRAAGAVWGK